MACNNGDSHNQSDAIDSAKTVNQDAKPVKPDTADFAVNAANGGIMDVELGRITQDVHKIPR